jgi:hypothetical protein
MRMLLALIVTLCCTTALADECKTVNATVGATTLAAVNICVPEGFCITNTEIAWPNFNPICPVTVGYTLDTANDTSIIIEPQVFGVAIDDKELQGQSVAGIPVSNRVPTIQDIVDANFTRVQVVETIEPVPGIARVSFQKEDKLYGVAFIRVESVKRSAYTLWTANVVAVLGSHRDDVLNARQTLKTVLAGTRPTADLAISIVRLMDAAGETNEGDLPLVREKIIAEAVKADAATKAQALQAVNANIEASLKLLAPVL